MLENDILFEYYAITRNDNHPFFMFNQQKYFFTKCTYNEQQFLILYQNYKLMLEKINKRGYEIILNKYQQMVSYQYLLFKVEEETFDINDLIYINLIHAHPSNFDIFNESNKIISQIKMIRDNYCESHKISENENIYILAMYYLGIAENCLSLIHSLHAHHKQVIIRNTIGHIDLTDYNYFSLFNPFNFANRAIIYDLAYLYLYQHIQLNDCIQAIKILDLNIAEYTYLFILVSYPFDFFHALTNQQKIDIDKYMKFLPIHQQRIKDLYRYISNFIPFNRLEWLLK